MIKIIDSTWKDVMQFPATKTGSISEDAEKAGYEIPTSCRAWACFVCAWRIKEGWECIDIGKISVPLIDIDEDQVLTCVWWIYDSYFDDEFDHLVVIEKDL